MPPKKQQLDQSAWSWAELVEPENVTWEHLVLAYRLNLKACKRGGCRRNCKGNPKCINALGESKWFTEIDETIWHEIDDPESERRDKSTFAGLKNLGATCYVNTFLQVWFHNKDIRKAVFGWHEGLSEQILLQLSQDLAELRSVKKPDELENLLTPTNICGQLQNVFALLQFSRRRYIDPTPFVTSLGLNATLQQDAQEFSKLFMSLLEDTLCQQRMPDSQNFVKSHFKGLYEYVTRCSFCQSESRRSSDFYELDLNIKGHKNLYECISEFLKEEKLEGDNKYMCSACNSKQNAVRNIQLRELPKILNLQLLRFVFERQTGHKKKLNTFIEFPERLDMSKYLRKQDGSAVYNLAAVLIHRGPSAYSGHYVAHVKDSVSNAWFKFNDEQIEKMAGKNLRLGNEEELEGKGPKKPKTDKGYHASRNAYTLVYHYGELPEDIKKMPTCGEASQSTSTDITSQMKEVERKDDNCPSTTDGTDGCHQTTSHMDLVSDGFCVRDLPLRTQKYLEFDNLRFEEWVEEMKAIRKNNVESGKARQSEVSGLFTLLPWKEGEAFEFLKTDWLCKWISAENNDKIHSVDNSSLLCNHSKLDPHKVPQAKCVSKEAAEVLCTKYGASQRLQRDSLCIQCVRERCRIIRTKARMAEDSKLITAFNKLKDQYLSPDECYWVGKQSLRCWKRLALGLIQDSHDQGEKQKENADSTPSSYDPKNGSSEMCESDVNKESGLMATDEISSEKPESAHKNDAQDTVPIEDTEPQQEMQFNEDILCEDHNKLNIDQSSRKLVTSEIWERLKWYFPKVNEYKGDAETCEECRTAVDEELKLKAFHKALALEQKASLADLYTDRKRPTWQSVESEVNVVSTEFIDMWRKFIRDPQRNVPPVTVNNSSLLCPHGGFLFSLQPGSDFNTQRICLLHPSEWVILKSHVQVDVEVNVVCIRESTGHVTYITSPEVCKECETSRQLEERQSRLQYTDASIYVRKVTDDLVPQQENDDNGVTDSSGQLSAESGSQEFDLIDQDTSKRKKTFGEDSYPSGKALKLEALTGGMRRSTRHRKVRGEKELTVNSSSTLRDLKLQIMKLFSVAPYDQNLMLEGRLLKGDHSTLESFSIYPGSVIYLKADEPVEDPEFLEDISKATCPEEGFKGTGLLGR